ncbi:MAG: G5 domain-containing protein [Candidatus Moranbacteria bacterium]|jgi:uncharacterized protein YabE (DUF348 family)|nr:G5 domain-containing protein [Candidatus Moranbacteria bacterium]
MLKKNKLKILIIFGLFLGFVFSAKAFFSNDEVIRGDENGRKKITVNDDGMIFDVYTQEKIVKDFLAEQKMEIGTDDQIVPNVESVLFSNSKVSIARSKKVVVSDENKKSEYATIFSDMDKFFSENGIKLAEFDIVNPPTSSPVFDGMKIEITRVDVEQEIENESIKFKTVTEKDEDMGWREEKIMQKGENGVKKVEYEVVYHNGKEISRKIKNTEIVQEPVEEIVKKGTFVKIGKVHTGLASWYAQPARLKSIFPSLTGYYAANPWLPKGSYVKVISKDNGQSIIVRINDVGPFGPGRIIDLDKSAFSAIASLGAGVVDVKMEEILN